MKLKVATQTARRWLRRRREARAITLPPEDLADLRFYQFKASTAKFFHERLGRCEVRVRDTPHYAFARSLACGTQDGREAEAFYRDYLRASWVPSKHGRIDARIDQFRRHFDHVIGAGKAPAVILTDLGNGHYVVDGNHRTAFAAALDRPIEAELWSPEFAFAEFSKVSAFYGTGNRGLPYQSLYVDQRTVVRGRRRDALDRLRAIPAEAVKGRTVLDLASNFGMSSILAKSFGATRCIGVEKSQQMVDLATRFAMFNGVYPQVSFLCRDLDDGLGDEVDTFDTAFIFSLHNHLRSPEVLCRIVERHVGRHVVFEGHPDTTRSDYATFLDGGLFSSVEEIGMLTTSATNASRNRMLLLCRR